MMAFSRLSLPQCINIFGLLEIVISTIGLLTLLCLQLTMLNIENEVEFIKHNHHGNANTSVSRSASFESTNALHTLLNATFTCDNCDCNLVTNSVQELLDIALKDRVGISHAVQHQRAEKVSETEMLCEIHVTTNVDPYETNENMPNPIANIVKDGIERLTRGDDEFSPYKQAIIDSAEYNGNNSRGGELISEKMTYPSHIDDDPGKANCIMVHMQTADSLEVWEDYRTVTDLFISSASCSILIGLVLIIFLRGVTRTMLCIIFLFEWICIGLLIAALVILNKPALCLLEYGGISETGSSSPKSGQSTITAISSIYLLLMKGCSICLIVVFAEKLYSEKKELETSPETQKSIKKFISEAAKRLSVNKDGNDDHNPTTGPAAAAPNNAVSSESVTITTVSNSATSYYSTN